MKAIKCDRCGNFVSNLGCETIKNYDLCRECSIQVNRLVLQFIKNRDIKSIIDLNGRDVRAEDW
jgi:hypothetical protein